MRIIAQRCTKASVSVDNKIVGKIGNGLMLLVGFTDTDDEKIIDYMVDKVINLRIFDDEDGVMNKSLLDIKGSILSSYIKALSGDRAIVFYDMLNKKIKEHGINIETGIFGAVMEVELINDGPTTIILEK